MSSSIVTLGIFVRIKPKRILKDMLALIMVLEGYRRGLWHLERRFGGFRLDGGGSILPDLSDRAR